ncbi:dTDP-glucose 4,6-dehydratase [Arenibacter sp. 6A1]|uniref:dTDP-glucose 4,6-dehydratase n=1 Tax=Arenibacter sp. 6A1 TaxID=2720391 RepID=UPI0014460FD6|nr:dTDP-glucose 4,6-dehydratase [Arenibacter sp. 6A1]NKI26861.1 dTDP-glucose 4,6-dehydratase [Arenibacter sp. 6A1]
MHILITGGAGFIGANFIAYLLNNDPHCSVINLDLLTYAGSLQNTEAFKDNDRYTFIKGDICDAALVQDIFQKYQIKAVFHFAAESHVDNSISSPKNFIRTNVDGTFCLLDAAKNTWMEGPHQLKIGFEKARFHHISTDEVYGSLGSTGFFTEDQAYAPNSPYSASKAASDFLVRSYFHTYGLNVVTTNCSNNYGPHQHDEKLIPTVIRKALEGADIPIYGDGKNIRDWLYVTDHCKGIYTVYSKGKAGETYLLGGNAERTNLEIVAEICAVLDRKLPKKDGSYSSQIAFVKDRPGHDFRYAIDFTKVSKELGWQPEEHFSSGMEKTVDWYIQKYKGN